jgi:hypothetical protein
VQYQEGRTLSLPTLHLTSLGSPATCGLPEPLPQSYSPTQWLMPVSPFGSYVTLDKVVNLSGLHLLYLQNGNNDNRKESL